MHQVLIEGAELRALKTLDLAESFGLDRRIKRSEGKTALGLYRWGLEGLLAALSLALDPPHGYRSSPGNKRAMKKMVRTSGRRTSWIERLPNGA